MKPSNGRLRRHLAAISIVVTASVLTALGGVASSMPTANAASAAGIDCLASLRRQYGDQLQLVQDGCDDGWAYVDFSPGGEGHHSGVVRLHRGAWATAFLPPWVVCPDVASVVGVPARIAALLQGCVQLPPVTGGDALPLTMGSSGPLVESLQRHLWAGGFDVGPSGADGHFGPATRRAVVQWQLESGRVISGQADESDVAAWLGVPLPAGSPGCPIDCVDRGRISFEHPAWGPVQLILATEPTGLCTVVVVDVSASLRWQYFSDRPGAGCRIGKDSGPSIDAAGLLHFWMTPWGGDGWLHVVLRPTADGFEHFGSLPDESGAGRFAFTESYDTDGDGIPELVQTIDCGSDCIPEGYWTYRLSGDDFFMHLCVRGNIDFAAVRSAPGTGNVEVGRIPPGTCGVASNVHDDSTGERWRRVWYGDASGWAHAGLFQPAPTQPPAPFLPAGVALALPQAADATPPPTAPAPPPPADMAVGTLTPGDVIWPPGTACTPELQGDLMLDAHDPAMNPPALCENGEWIPTF